MRYPFAVAILSTGLVLAACSWFGGGSQPEPEPEPQGPTPEPERHSVLLEIDRMQGRPGIADAGRITEIFAAAGIDVEVRTDQDDLPTAPSVDLADLHSLMTTHRSLDAEPGVWKLHMLIVSAEEGRPRTLGIMFDFGDEDLNDIPREGFAVFADAHEASTRAEEMLLTAVHELAHCFNIHHTDWEGSSFNADGTIESYSMADTVRWELSERSKDHFAGSPVSMFKPGPGGVTFGHISRAHADRHQSTPLESYVIVDRLAAARGRAVEASATRRHARARDAGDTWWLALSTPERRYVVGEPVWVDVELTNESDLDRRLLLDLHPRAGLMTVRLRGPGMERSSLFVPPVHACARRPLDVMPARSSAEDTFQVFFDSRGWTITTPGTYTIEASFPVTPPGQEPVEYVDAEPLVLEIEAPPEAEASRKRILDHDVGVYLMLGGASHLRAADRDLARLFTEGGLRPGQKAAIGLALAKARFDPSLSGRPGARREQPDPEEAAKFLESLPEAEINLREALRTQKAFVESLGPGEEIRKRDAEETLERLRERARRQER